MDDQNQPNVAQPNVGAPVEKRSGQGDRHCPAGRASSFVCCGAARRIRLRSFENGCGIRADRHFPSSGQRCQGRRADPRRRDKAESTHPQFRRSYKVDSEDFQLHPGEGVEMKYHMQKGAVMVYGWKAGRQAHTYEFIVRRTGPETQQGLFRELRTRRQDR